MKDTTKIGFAIVVWALVLALAIIAFVNAGCQSPPDEAVGDEPTDPVEPADPDLPEVEPVPLPPDPEPQVLLTFDGPPAGSEVGTGAKDHDALCFTLEATRDVEIRKFRFEFAASSVSEPVQGGLVNGIDDTPNYEDLKVVDPATGQVVMGPVELFGAGSDGLQVAQMYDIFVLFAGTPRTLCLKADVRNSADMAGDEIRVTLLPFATGDIRFADDFSDFPVGNVEPAGGLSTSFTVKAPAPPAIAQLPLPTTVMSDGENVIARLAIVAGTEDVFVKKLSFPVTRIYLPLPGMPDPALRIVGDDTDLPAAAVIVNDGSPGCGYGPTGPTIVCVKFVLDDEIHVPVGGAVTLEVRVTLSDVTPGSIASCLPFDLTAAAGDLIGSGTDVSVNGQTSHIIWSNDLDVYRNGNGLFTGCTGWILSHS